MYVEYNQNPSKARIGDCVIRAIAKVFDISWIDAFLRLTTQAMLMYDLPSANRVWGEYLHDNGFRRYVIPDTCPDCYTVKDFCRDHPRGTFVLALDSHVVAVIDGSYYDTWDSGDESPNYYWRCEDAV